MDSISGSRKDKHHIACSAKPDRIVDAAWRKHLLLLPVPRKKANAKPAGMALARAAVKRVKHYQSNRLNGE